MTWITQFLFSWWVSWWNSWNSETIMATYYGYSLFAGTFLGFCFGVVSEIRKKDRGVFNALGWGLIGAACGCFFGAIAILFILAALPIWVLTLYVLGMLILGFFPIYFVTMVLPKKRKVLKYALRNIRSSIGKRLRFRRQPEDYLTDLDRQSEKVSQQLENLVARKKALQEYITQHTEHAAEAERRKYSATLGSAAEKIASDVLTRFQEKVAGAQKQMQALLRIIQQIEAGRQEMSNLIGLAKLCRLSKEDDLTGDTRALEAAQAALQTLREAFDRADAVLSAAVAEADLNLDLAYQQTAEGLRRSNALSDVAESIATPLPSRQRA